MVKKTYIKYNEKTNKYFIGIEWSIIKKDFSYYEKLNVDRGKFIDNDDYFNITYRPETKEFDIAGSYGNFLCVTYEDVKMIEVVKKIISDNL